MEEDWKEPLDKKRKYSKDEEVISGRRSVLGTTEEKDGDRKGMVQTDDQKIVFCEVEKFCEVETEKNGMFSGNSEKDCVKPLAQDNFKKDKTNIDKREDHEISEERTDYPMEVEEFKEEIDDCMKEKVLQPEDQMVSFEAEDVKSERSSGVDDEGKYQGPHRSIDQTFDKQEFSLQEHHEDTKKEKVADEQNEDQGIENILDRLELSKFFPNKITLEILRKKSRSRANSLPDIPWYFLYRISMLDYKGRDEMISETVEDALSNACDTQNADVSIDEIDMFEDFICSENILKLKAPHPLDVVIAVFLCSSNYVRQMLCEKMFMCKLSIPIVLPPYMENKPLLLLWALRSICFQSKLQKGELQNSSVVSITMPVISCLRLGEISRSKSKFLNEMVNDQSHDTFFHRDCKNGMNDRILTDGLIEVAWYIASVKAEKSDNSRETTAFLNLRGDGTLQETNVTFLAKISNVVLIMIDISRIEAPSIISSLNTIRNCDAKIILMITSLPSVKYSATTTSRFIKFIDDMKWHHSKKNIILDFNTKGCKNMKMLKSETEKKITDCLKTFNFTQTLESTKDHAISLQIEVDEHTPECFMSKDLAVKVMTELNEAGVEGHRIQMLPLQGKPWQDWSKLNKEEHRREKKYSENLTSYMDKLYMEKNQRRVEQLQLLENPSAVFDSFFRYFLNLENNTRFYYLKWIKLYLDDMSKKVLPDLRDDCCSKWNEIQLCDTKEEYLHLQKELDLAEQSLAVSSISLEHLIREMAQMYEAVDHMKEEASDDMRNKVTRLPNIMAELMIQGFPLEIMDGDVGHIPLKWVKDVFGQLVNILGNQNIFVLSVLGIQSSGKSTLLNTMFGLQFEVAAGRCTRGVYAQLLPLSEEYSSDKYDYILVVDTEGLRANELGKVKLQNDNEIATLVTGIGDVTLVNIKGENVSEMEDVLQIVIHALLKMKLVNKSLELQPSCFFIHQNVPAVDAAQNLRSGQQVFMETLDKVTRAAAKQEDAPQFTKFRQVIEFDINTCITYFSDLWEGDPPMAPVNPGYSKNVSKVKETLLTSIMCNRASQLTLQKFSQKLTDLWNGILDQNFIFSFRNSLELEAYGTLEIKLADLSWSLKDAALKWENSMGNKMSDGEISELDVDMNECRRNLDECFLACKNELERFFAVNEEGALLEQWRHSTSLKLSMRYDEIVHRTVLAVRDEVQIRKIQIDQKGDLEKYRCNLMKEAKKLAEELGGDIPEDDLKEKFNIKWKIWKSELPKSSKMDYINIEEAVYNILTERYIVDKALVISAWDDIQKKQMLTFEKFYDNVKWALERNLKRSVLKQFMSLFTPVQTREECLQVIACEISCEFQNLIEHNKISGFTSDFAQVIIHRTKCIVSRLKDGSFKLKNEEKLSISIAIFACQFACYQCQYRDNVLNENTMASFGIHPIFENVLREHMPASLLTVFYELRDHCKAKQQNLSSFKIDAPKHLRLSQEWNYDEENIIYAEGLARALLENVKMYIQKRDIQAFREEYIEEVFKMVEELIVKECLFTKLFKIDLIVHACLYVIPFLIEKHQRYLANTDAGAVFERDYYSTYYEMFKNLYYEFTDDKGLAMVLTKQLCKSVENAVDIDMARELAGDVRNNVQEVKLKSTLLEAVLRKLLEEDNFDDFYLYLTDIDGCMGKWISSFINNYLFTETTEGSNRYVEIAAPKVKAVISLLTQEISKSSNGFSDSFNSKDALNKWILKFHQKIRKILPLPLRDLRSIIDGYDISSLKSFTNTVISMLRDSECTIVNEFRKHDVNHLQTAYGNSVYKLIARECKGCTEKCPFCAAPCILNTVGHFEQDVPVQHNAKEHYSQACGGWRSSHTGKLVTENCSFLVASDSRFRYDLKNDKIQPYKSYYEIYPSWKIHGDPSVEASPYWKWFLVKYGEHIAKEKHALKPDIPESWHHITKEMAKESLKL